MLNFMQNVANFSWAVLLKSSLKILRRLAEMPWCYHSQCQDWNVVIRKLAFSFNQSINQSVDFYSGLSGATTARITSWMMSGYACLNKKRVSSRRKVDSELAATTSVGSGLAVYSRCVEPQPQRLGCRLLTVWRVHEAVGIVVLQ